MFIFFRLFKNHLHCNNRKQYQNKNKNKVSTPIKNNCQIITYDWDCGHASCNNTIGNSNQLRSFSFFIQFSDYCKADNRGSTTSKPLDKLLYKTNRFRLHIPCVFLNNAPHKVTDLYAVSCFPVSSGFGIYAGLLLFTPR